MDTYVVQGLMIFAIVGAITLCFWVFFIRSDTMMYCDYAREADDCIPCPIQAFGVEKCESGRIICKQGFVERNDVCVENHHLDVIQKTVNDILVSQAGVAECSELGVYGFFVGEQSKALPEEELKKRVQQSVGENIKEKELNELFNILILRNQREPDSGKILMIDRVPHWMTNKAPLYPYTCRVEKWLGFSLFNKILASFFLVSVVMIHRVRRISQKNKELSFEIFTKVCKYLAELSTCEQHWMEVSALKRQIMKEYPTLSSSRIEAIWESIENFALVDNRIKELPRVVQGEQVETWQWVG